MWWSVRALLAVVAALTPTVRATPNGVPLDACVSMQPRGPGHQDALPQSSSFPYNVEVTDSLGIVQITIGQSGGNTFMGFMVQARAPDSNVPLGTFTPTDPLLAKTISCTSQGDTASHTNSQTKDVVSLTWTPGLGQSGEVFFLVTIVQIPSIFWVQQDVGFVFIRN